jgi:Heterokaryon incompatibility protein (HET)
MEASVQDPVRPSIYEPLDYENLEIRILTLMHGTSESDVRYTLTKTNHISPTAYSALSYCWGDPNLTTDIIVNNIVTPVRANLADALCQLRRLGVSRIWVDALCINQEDTVEKNYQIRYMKHIYARAEQTYAWIGKEEADQSAAAISFLQMVFDNSDGTVLAEISHDHQAVEVGSRSMLLDEQDTADSVRDSSFPIILPQKEDKDCQCCLLELQFRALRAFFDRAYWKRRWIIQELAVSPQVRVQCGNVGIEFDKMSSAIAQCQRSCYWRPEADSAILHLKRVQEFRQYYRNATDLPLFKAISRSYGFLSTDPRDTIYALLGLCYDSADLVPLPNYKQPIEAILSSLTKILIWKTACLDVILVDRTRREPSTTGLPSWAPNLFQGSWLPEEAYDFSSLKLQFERSLIPTTDLINSNVLRVQGVIIGAIVDVTSTFYSTVPPRPDTLEPGNISSSGNSLGPLYYHCENEVLAALLSCLLTDIRHIVKTWDTPREEKFWAGDDHDYFHGIGFMGMPIPFSRRLAWNVLRLFRQRALCIASPSNDIEAGGYAVSALPTAFNGWISANGAFTVHRKTLQEWFAERDFGFYFMSAIKGSKTAAMVVLCTCLLLLLIPGLAVFVHFLIKLNINDHQTGAGAVIGIIAFAILPTFFGPWWIQDVPAFFQNIQPLPFATLTDESVLNTKLVVSDRGFIGRACAGAEIGDKICLVVGCTKAVVLREVRSENGVQYTVVGGAVVALSSRDRGRYWGFLQNKSDSGYRNWDPVSKQNMSDKTRNTLLRGYKKSGMLGELELI